MGAAPVGIDATRRRVHGEVLLRWIAIGGPRASPSDCSEDVCDRTRHSRYTVQQGPPQLKICILLKHFSSPSSSRVVVCTQLLYEHTWRSAPQDLHLAQGVPFHAPPSQDATHARPHTARARHTTTQTTVNTSRHVSVRETDPGLKFSAMKQCLARNTAEVWRAS